MRKRKQLGEKQVLNNETITQMQATIVEQESVLTKKRKRSDTLAEKSRELDAKV